MYLRHSNLTPHAFEKGCGIANGYLKKQMKGKGTIGSEILDKILATHKSLSLSWLITGKGAMLTDVYSETDNPASLINDNESVYNNSSAEIIKLLREKIAVLENALADKEKIIRMLEEKIRIQ